MLRTKHLVALLLALLSSACSISPTSAPYPTPIDNSAVLAEMAATRERAAANQQLALYVLGANWCHDSTDFVTLLNDNRVKPLITKDYAVQYINVGTLDHIRPFITPYGPPVIYATPTVLIVDPVSNKLLNRATMTYWGNASNMSSRDAVEYFQQFNATNPPPGAPLPSSALQRALAAIDQFEDVQAQRIYAAYAVLGPMMQAMDAGHPEAGFMEKWGNLAKMRSAITTDLRTLRDEAAAQDAAGVTDIVLVFPSYELFIDQ